MTSGSQPDPVTFSWNLDMAAGETDEQTFTFANPDGAQNYTFTLDYSSVISTDESCSFQPGLDMAVSLKQNLTTVALSETIPVKVELPPGDSDLTLIAVSHESTCPLGGLISVTGELA